MNVSARQFADTGFAGTVRQAIAASGLEPQAIMLELTESALLRRDERLHSELAELKGIGVKLAIDDFGTGYSSLSYLRDLPIDVVKMDKSFVEGIADSDQRLALAEGIIQIAQDPQPGRRRRGDRNRGTAGPALLDGLSLRAGVPAGDADAA